MPGTIDPVTLFLLVISMSFLPFMAMTVTSYTKIVVVLGLLRNALGIQQVPPNMVINGIALIVSCYVMAPVFSEAYDAGAKRPASQQASQQLLGMFDAAREPFRQFLKRHAAEREKAFFQKSASALWSEEQAEKLHPDDLIMLAPAFVLSELTAAFKIGFLLYLVFIVIDLVIANVLVSMGLSQVQPASIAIPFKLLLFVLLDGWSALIHGLVMTYR